MFGLPSSFLASISSSPLWVQLGFAFVTVLWLVLLGYLARVSVFWSLQKIFHLSKNSQFIFIKNLISGIDIFGYLVIGIQFATQNLAILNLNPFWQKVLDSGLVVIGTLFITTKIQQVVFGAINSRLEQKQKDAKGNTAKTQKDGPKDGQKRHSLDPSLITIIKYFTTILIWLVAILLLLQSFEVNLTAVLGGLGITGIAVAFALQNILGDLFASIGLYTDQPFRTGDFIKVGGKNGESSGTVEQIGLRTTRIRTLEGDLLVYNNRKLTEAEVFNVELMKRRRIVINFGVEYGTSKAQIVEILKGCEQIGTEITKGCGDFDRVHFYRLGSYSLDFELVYYINTGDYGKYMDSLQQCNLMILELLEKVGTKLAYPTQSVRVET